MRAGPRRERLPGGEPEKRPSDRDGRPAGGGVISVRWHADSGAAIAAASRLLAVARRHTGAPATVGPTAVVVLDPGLWVEVAAGARLRPDSLLLVNDPRHPDQLRTELGIEADVRSLDATALSPRFAHLAMVGALAGAIGSPSRVALLEAADELLGRRLPAETMTEVEQAIADGHQATAAALAGAAAGPTPSPGAAAPAASGTRSPPPLSRRGR
jgi:hypothetical protein